MNPIPWSHGRNHRTDVLQAVRQGENEPAVAEAALRVPMTGELCHHVDVASCRDLTPCPDGSRRLELDARAGCRQGGDQRFGHQGVRQRLKQHRKITIGTPQGRDQLSVLLFCSLLHYCLHALPVLVWLLIRGELVENVRLAGGSEARHAQEEEEPGESTHDGPVCEVGWGTGEGGGRMSVSVGECGVWADRCRARKQGQALAAASNQC